MTDAVTPTPPPESVVVPQGVIEKITLARRVLDKQSLVADEKVFDAKALLDSAAAQLAAALISPPAADARSDGLREALRIARQYVLDDVKRKPTEYDPSVDLARIDAALSAPAAKAADPVPVAPGWAPKKLGWKEKKVDDLWSSLTAFCTQYRIYNQRSDGRYSAHSSGEHFGIFDTLEAAQAAAQADFDRRVRECVDAPARDGAVDTISDATVEDILAGIDLRTGAPS